MVAAMKTNKKTITPIEKIPRRQVPLLFYFLAIRFIAPASPDTPNNRNIIEQV
jgi:hypothetical protein